jgi:hypothetical protein
MLPSRPISTRIMLRGLASVSKATRDLSEMRLVSILAYGEGNGSEREQSSSGMPS